MYLPILEQFSLNPGWAVVWPSATSTTMAGSMSSPPTTVRPTFCILHNETPTQNHWLTLKFVGHKSNRDGIGAEIKLTTSLVARTHPCGTLSIALSPLSGLPGATMIAMVSTRSLGN